MEERTNASTHIPIHTDKEHIHTVYVCIHRNTNRGIVRQVVAIDSCDCIFPPERERKGENKREKWKVKR